MRDLAEKLAAAVEAAGIGIEQAEELIGQAGGAMLFGIVRSLVDAGMPVGDALRLAAFIVIDGSAGRGASAAFGLSDRQVRQYRAEIRAATQAVEPSGKVPRQYRAEWASAMEDRTLWAGKRHNERR